MKHNQPLGIPEGSVRAMVALICNLGAVIYILLYQDFPGELMTLVALIDGYYFGAREKQPNVK